MFCCRWFTSIVPPQVGRLTSVMFLVHFYRSSTSVQASATVMFLVHLLSFLHKWGGLGLFMLFMCFLVRFPLSLELFVLIDAWRKHWHIHTVTLSGRKYIFFFQKSEALFGWNTPSIELVMWSSNLQLITGSVLSKHHFLGSQVLIWPKIDFQWACRPISFLPTKVIKNLRIQLHKEFNSLCSCILRISITLVGKKEIGLQTHRKLYLVPLKTTVWPDGHRNYMEWYHLSSLTK